MHGQPNIKNTHVLRVFLQTMPIHLPAVLQLVQVQFCSRSRGPRQGNRCFLNPLHKVTQFSRQAGTLLATKS